MKARYDNFHIEKAQMPFSHIVNVNKRYQAHAGVRITGVR